MIKEIHMLKGQILEGKNSGGTLCAEGNIGGTNGRGTRDEGANTVGTYGGKANIGEKT
jgi:hypothetical protein